MKLFDYQKEALAKLKNGSILCGGVGSGKSRTALAYYHTLYFGGIEPFTTMSYPADLYIITTARKRDTLEWEGEMAAFCLYPNDIYNIKVVVDSWNNIKKYVNVEKAFFIFDEQRVVGAGTWSKSFIKIAKKNNWILLSATPGDTWSDYIPVFIANGFYKNRSEFIEKHIVYKFGVKFPVIDKYINTGKLVRQRNSILVDMDFKRKTNAHHDYIFNSYDKNAYKIVNKDRWNPFDDCPIENISEFCYILRRIVNSDETRQAKVLELVEKHPKAIIFYNFDYELELLKTILKEKNIAEWNGHKHQPTPDGNEWVYLVQYTAGAEGWNCITTDTIIFYSQNYSYKILHQSCGRIDRLNTPYRDLYYYHLMSKAPIDLAIKRALDNKKTFNESRYINKVF